jgi:hypothetical protein
VVHGGLCFVQSFQTGAGSELNRIEAESTDHIIGRFFKSTKDQNVDRLELNRIGRSNRRNKARSGGGGRGARGACSCQRWLKAVEHEEQGKGRGAKGASVESQGQCQCQ